jgi:molybdopterin molybdotransferase
MLEVTAAQAEVLRHATPRKPEVSPVSSSALGLVVAEDILADRDLPPFPKAMMDGFAVRAADCVQANSSLTIIEVITAGKLPTKAISAGQAARINTGSPVPDGADAVMMIEDCRIAGDRVTISGTPASGQHIQPVGREMRRGETVIAAGTVLGPAHFAVLSTVGRTSVKAYPAPRVALLATGNELVEPAMTPGPGQIRNSNVTMLVAQCVQVGALPRSLGIARDDRDHLRSMIKEGLTADVLILSGGVSAGTLDLVPELLQELGVRPVFHKVAMKPGKPLFFGTFEKTLVFGLPGNPVSSFVGFELFVRPAILRLRNVQPAIPILLRLPLMEAVKHHGDRPTYHPAKVVPQDVGEAVSIVPWHGSPDLKGLCPANALVLLEPGERTYPAGSLVPVMRLPG